MSFFARLFGRGKKHAPESSCAPASAKRGASAGGDSAKEVALGSQATDAAAKVDHPFSRSDGDEISDDDALPLLSKLRNDPNAGGILAEMRACGGESRLSFRARLRLADLLRERGEVGEARRIAAGDASAEGLFLSADLASDAGDLGVALSTIERVLAQKIDFPGARERHRRWSEALGLRTGPSMWSDGATLLAPSSETPFVLHREIARGGAGVVYEARDRILHRRVAVKFYHEPKKHAVQLLREARLATALRSRHVVRVFDADATAGWIAMEWSSGGSLRTRFLRARETARIAGESQHDDIFPWALALAEALAFVHDKGFVHLDVKPGNVLVMEDGRIALSDFGLSRKQGEAVDGGSLGFISPERLQGKVAEARDDVYGLGRMIEDALPAGVPSDALRTFIDRCLSGNLTDGKAALAALESARG